MADNVAVTEGSGKTVATDDVGGVQYQRVKVDLGGDSAASPLLRGQQADAASVPVTLSTEQAAFLSALAGIISSARAAVNLIAGQAGVAAGAGAVGATVQRMTLASDDPAVAHLATLAGAVEYEPVAASQTDQILGATGAVGDLLAGVLVVPATTGAGAVAITDGNGTPITIFSGGVASLTALVPFYVPLGIKSVNSTTPGWKITTGASVSALGVGNFT